MRDPWLTLDPLDIALWLTAALVAVLATWSMGLPWGWGR